MEKQNVTQQKHTFTNPCITTQNKHKKTKARFRRLLRYRISSNTSQASNTGQGSDGIVLTEAGPWIQAVSRI